MAIATPSSGGGHTVLTALWLQLAHLAAHVVGRQVVSNTTHPAEEDCIADLLSQLDHLPPDSPAMTTSTASATTTSGLVFRPASERFHSQFDWLDSWHTFSFSSHYDPAWMGFGPLRVINDDTIAAGTGFGMHPHRDMEIVTVMVEGQLNHRDSMGHAEVLRAGEVQRMSAGTGVVHSEMNQASQSCRLLQIWIEPTSTGIAPSYEQKAFAIGSGWTPLLDPDQVDGAMAIHRPVRLWRAQPAPQRTLTLPVAPGTKGWLHVIEGGLQVEAEADPGMFKGHLEKGDGIGFYPGAIRSITAMSPDADLLLFELR